MRLAGSGTIRKNAITFVQNNGTPEHKRWSEVAQAESTSIELTSKSDV